MTRTCALLFPLILLASSCYEDRIACLDPDASNYDLRADDACPDDCCNYPNVSLRISRVWGDTTFFIDSIYTDGADNEFRIIRLRFYLGGLELETGDRLLPTPENLVEVGVIGGTDTVTSVINANLALVATTGAGPTIGTYRGGGVTITGLIATLGLPAEFNAIAPSTAPAASPLSTQPGLLNLRDGRGYVQASLEYQLVATGDTIRTDVYGLEELRLELPEGVLPVRGNSLNLLLQVDYEKAFEDIDLVMDPEDFAGKLSNALLLTGAN